MDTPLKTFMQNQASSVYVIHTFCEKGAYGMTASSLSSCSLSPPLFTFNVENHSRMWTFLQEAKYLCFQQLNEKQQDYSVHFAKGAESSEALYRDLDLDFVCEGRLPCLKDCQPSLLASIKQRVAVGDHHLIVAELEKVLSPLLKAPPLVYYRQAYHRLA